MCTWMNKYAGNELRENKFALNCNYERTFVNAIVYKLILGFNLNYKITST